MWQEESSKEERKSAVQGSPGARPSSRPLSSSSTLNGRKGVIDSFSLPNPKSMSHEGLAFTSCPLCHAPSIHLRQMKSHLMAVHAGFADEALYTKACEVRLALYEEVIGTPLPHPEAAEQRRRVLERQAQLPTITPEGHYFCNWCLIRQEKPFLTRDALLQHVAIKHPEQDLNEVEQAVPLPSSSIAQNAGGSKAFPGARRTAGESGGEMTAGPDSSRSSASSAFSDLRIGVASPASQGTSPRTPTRRLPGVKPLPAASSLVPLMGVRTPGRGGGGREEEGKKYEPARIGRGRLSPTHSGISIPRHLDAGREKEVSGGGARTNSASSTSGSATPLSSARVLAQFGNGKFPCELCGRVLQSESDLLQHLENRHTEVNAPGVASSGGGVVEVSSSAGGGGGKLSLGALMKAEMGSGTSKGNGKSPGVPSALSGQVLVTCDLCANSSKVYTLASALFAHIRFKHPAEDAAYHVERMVEVSRRQGGGASLQRFTCSYCNKVFASQEALQGHITSKHEPDSPTVTRNPATAGALGVVTEKTQWWCNDCEKGFKSGRALLGHRVSKHMLDLKSHNCPACKRVFTDVFSLEEHMKQLHPTLAIEDLGLMAGVLCNCCDRRFLEVKDLQAHLLRHHPGKSTLTKEAIVVTTKGFTDPHRMNTVPLHGKNPPQSDPHANRSKGSPTRVAQLIGGGKGKGMRSSSMGDGEDMDDMVGGGPRLGSSLMQKLGIREAGGGAPYSNATQSSGTPKPRKVARRK